MSWHYLPVFQTHNGERGYSLIEVHLDAEEKLKSWTVSRSIAPVGNDIDDLEGSLKLMLKDTRRWKPVAYEKLKVGMKFTRIDRKAKA